MSLDVDALRESFDLVAERSPTLIHRFYEMLFARYPAAKQLFGRNTAAKQEEMLTRALAAVLDHLDDAPWLKETLTALGAKHVDYGVTDEMYGWVGECLLATLAEVAASDWTRRVESAWTDAYGAISTLMLAGAHATSAHPASKPVAIEP
jgi:hemoglobin-like flavoprotein